MAKDPAFLFYPNDYLGGTMGMSFDLKGAYVDLFILQFNTGGFTEDQAINTVGHERWKSLKKKFTSTGPLFYNERLKNEIEKRKKFSEHQRNNVNKRYQKSTKPLTETDTNDITKTIPLENEDENRNEIDNGNEVKGVQGDLIQLCLGDAIWCENVCRIHKKTQYELHTLIEEFGAHQVTMQQISQSLRDFKQHFNNWLRKKAEHNVKHPTEKKSLGDRV